MPYNVASSRHYRGVNTLALWSVAQARGYDCNAWGTYKQWAERGAQVRKGEHGALVVFWKFDGAAPVDGDADGPAARRRVLARGYTVFNASQVDGYKADPAPAVIEQERDAAAEAWFAGLGANVSHGGNRAFYMPAWDRIQMPPFSAFSDRVAYYSTLAHECTHWTGHAKRCNRDMSGRFGNDAYAAEELVAELGAAFVCATLRLASEPRPDHASYIDTWLRVLRGDKRAVFTAASKAQAAMDWMLGQIGAAVVPDDMREAA